MRPQMVKNSKQWLVNLGRAGGAVMGLALVWVGWQPTYFTLPEALARPADTEELAALTLGSPFLIEGTVVPALWGAREWQGRFVYVHRQRKELSTGLTKEQRVVDIEDWRPTVEFGWSGGTWRIPADSYALDYAPNIKPRWWPRQALGMLRVDDWHESSTGFRRGEAALALGRIQSDGVPLIEQLMASPVERVAEKIGYENRLRSGLVFAFKLGLTLFCVAYGLPRPKRSAHPG